MLYSNNRDIDKALQTYTAINLNSMGQWVSQWETAFLTGCGHGRNDPILWASIH